MTLPFEESVEHRMEKKRCIEKIRTYGFGQYESIYFDQEKHDDIGRNYRFLQSQDDLTMMKNSSDQIKRAGLINPDPFKLMVTRQIETLNILTTVVRHIESS